MINLMSNSSFRKLASQVLVAVIMSIGLTISQAALADETEQLSPSQSKSLNQSLDKKDWQLNNLEGNPVVLSDFEGQPVLLVFWATWCPYCKKLLPGIQTLHDKYHSLGLKVIGVNIREDWKPHVYWRNHEYTFDTVLEGDEIANHYGIKGTPGIVFIDPRGEVLAVKSFSDPNHPTLEVFAKKYTSDK